MSRLSTELATELDYFRLLRRQRIINASEFQREKRKLERRQEELDELARQRQLQASFLKREAEKKRKRQELRLRKREQAQAQRDLLFRGTSGERVFQFLREAYARTAGHQTIRTISRGGSINGNVIDDLIHDMTIRRPDTEQDFIKLFFIYEGGDFIERMIEGGSLLIFKPTSLPIVRLRQMFRDGIDHCVFSPILKKLTESMKSCKSKESIKRYKQRINKLQDLEEFYSTGVPEDKMEEIAKASGYKIVVLNVIGKDILTFNDTGRLGVIRLTNTRPNHLEEGYVTLDQDFEEVSESEIVKIWLNAAKKNEFYMIEGDIKNNAPRRLRLLNRAFRVIDPNEEYFNKMNELIDLNRYRFNATKYPEVNEFIKAGRIINAWVCPFSDEKPTGHLDMPKAYSQFKKCDYYDGFLGVVHEWRCGSFDRQWISKKIGLYRFKVLECTNALFQKLGIINDSVHILPSPEILYFIDNGVVVEIDAGVWGSRFDFEFPDEMLEDRRYCLWSGRLGMERTTRNFSFHSNSDWASHLKSEMGDDCFYWEDKQICSIRVPVKNVLTTHHIFAFITSYVRIQMMQAMSKFELNQIVKVLLDGIYFTGAKPMGLEWFREKEIKEYSANGFEWYCGSSLDVNFPSVFLKGNTLLTGQGGAGKTYKVMTDKGFNKILFVTPQHVLGTDVINKYKTTYTTIHKLIGEDCQPYYLEHAYPPVLFVDEITQIPSSWISKIFSMYKDSLIILAGDVNENGQWFQCRNGRPGLFSAVWKPVDVDVMCIEGDRRSRDDKLRKLKIDVRGVMEKYFLDGDSGEDLVMQRWAKKNLPITDFDTACSMFRFGDCWIAGTHKTSNKLLENGVVSGWYKYGGHIENHYVEGYDKRGSFTVHSYQGRTLEEGKIFISIGDLFEYAMLYTAISRAVHYDQLVFVA